MRQSIILLRNTLKASLIIAVSLVALSIIVLLVFPLEPIAQKAFTLALNSSQFSDSNFTIKQATSRKLVVEDIDIGDASHFSVKRVTIDYSLDDLWQKRVDTITIEGLSLKGEQHADGNNLSFGRLDTFLKRDTEEPLQDKKKDMSVLALPFNNLAVVKSYLTVNAPTHTLTLPFALTVAPDKEQSLAIDIMIDQASVTLLKIDIPTAGTLSVVSKFSAELPFFIEGKYVVLRNGHLRSIEGGNIQLMSAIAPNDKSMKILLDALTDYNYKSFHMTLNSDKTGKLISALSLEGNNKSLYADRDIELNVNLTLNIYDTIRNVMGAYHLSDAVMDGLFKLQEKQ